MKISRSGLFLFVVSFSALMVQYASGDEPFRYDSERLAPHATLIPLTEFDDSAMHVSAPEAPVSLVLNVRIHDEAGSRVFEETSSGGTILVPVQNWPDGEYRFESIIVTLPGDPEEQETHRNFGEFRILDGMLVLGPGAGHETSYEAPGRWRDGIKHFLMASIDFFLPSAGAFDLTASGTAPAVRFDDTQDPLNFPFEWALIWDYDDFYMFDTWDNTVPFRIDSSSVNNLSFDVRPDGDIGFSNGLFWMERVGAHFGIGTSDPDESIDIYDAVPRIRLNDEDTGTSMGMVFNSGLFALEGSSGQDVIFFDQAANAESIRVFGNGDVTMAGGRFQVDRQAGPFDDIRVGIGINAPAASLHISEPIPALFLTDESNDLTAGLRLDASILALIGQDAGSTRRIIWMRQDAPPNSMVVQADGNIGFGLLNPEQSLHLRRADGTAQLWVQETNATQAARTLFKLSNAGNTKFELEESASGNTWAFTNSGQDFRVSLQGSGAIEFRLDNSGNAFLAGALSQNSDRNAKTDILSVDADKVLAKVALLPISEWSYKDTPDTRHIGPMAQDFRAAFGTGASDTSLSTLDVSGVAIASIQALERRNRELETRIAELESREREETPLRERLALVEAMLTQLLPRTAQN